MQYIFNKAADVIPRIRKLMFINNEKGFSLIEIAIVMVIIGLLVGGSIPLMRVLNERKLRNENLEYMQQAKEAIISFAIINGRLPWADTNSPADGVQDAGAVLGTLPFVDLSLPPHDSYGRVVKYVVNSGLINSRQTSCTTLMSPLAGNPLVVDAEGSTTAFPVAAILISSGPTTPYGVIGGSPGGNNITGSLNYIKSFLTATFDDEVVYIGGFELYGKVCGNSTTATIKNNTTTPATDIYVRRIAPVPPPAGDVGFVGKPGGPVSNIATFSFTPGTRIEVYSGPNGTGSNLTPTSPLIVAGEGLIITIP